MKFIVFDLEWNPVFRKGKLTGQEITEIGAVEVSGVYNKLPIKAEPFVSNQLFNTEYRKQVHKIADLRKKLGSEYYDLSLAPK